MKNKTLIIADNTIEPGTKKNILLPSASLYTQHPISMPAIVIHGKKAGPKVFVIGTIHGDELNSIEIIRRLHKHKQLKNLRGTLITISIANVFGLMLRSRYLPDRRDLNRSFPGSPEGSLAARIAYLLIQEIVSPCNYGIDLHTGAVGRVNLPQLRVNLDTPGAKHLSQAFNVPVILNAKIRDGSLRQAASELSIPLLVYEGGEALRLNEMSVRVGVRGILNVLATLGMIEKQARKKTTKKIKPIISQTSRWVRATNSGLVQPIADVADVIKKGAKLAYIHDPYLMNASVSVVAPFDGIIIGKSNFPLVNEGDAMYNIASLTDLENMEAFIEELQDEISE
jgi:predicted deacylase